MPLLSMTNTPPRNAPELDLSAYGLVTEFSTLCNEPGMDYVWNIRTSEEMVATVVIPKDRDYASDGDDPRHIDDHHARIMLIGHNAACHQAVVRAISDTFGQVKVLNK